MAETSIFRQEHNTGNPYAMICKATLHDKKLSWKARGILAYLLSLPNDWQIYENELIQHTKDGRDSTRAGIKELIGAGYITRHQRMEPSGKFAGYEYVVSEVPKNRDSNRVGFSDNGFSATTNKDLTNKRQDYDDYGNANKIDISPCSFNQYIKGNRIQSNAIPVVEYYLEMFKQERGKKHPNMTEEQWKHVMDKIMILKIDTGDLVELTDTNLFTMIDAHFNTRYKNCNYQILHFITDGIMQRRFFEKIYHGEKEQLTDIALN